MNSIKLSWAVNHLIWLQAQEIFSEFRIYINVLNLLFLLPDS